MRLSKRELGSDIIVANLHVVSSICAIQEIVCHVTWNLNYMYQSKDKSSSCFGPEVGDRQLDV